MTLLAVDATVSVALVLGALWALYGRLGDRTEGFVLAAGGGALMFSAVLELIVPAQEFISLTATGLALMIGAGTFALIDYLIDNRWGDEGGVGLLAAATLDGVPENLALGVATGISGADARLRRRRHHRSPRHRNLPQGLPPRPPNGRNRDRARPPRGSLADPQHDGLSRIWFFWEAVYFE